MKVISSCPMRVASIVWQAASGISVVTVAAKATFVLRPAESPLSDEQEDPNPADGYWNDDERRSLHVAGDLVPLKTRADVTLVGHAFAPRGVPVRSLVTRMVIGDVDKSIEVCADRAFALDGSLHEGPAFATMPLVWERAAGGPHTSNPVGVRADAAPDARGWTPLPNLQPPGIHVAGRGDFIAPVGYGPISPWWPGRQGKLHRGVAGWDFQRWFHRPLPTDLDGGFFNAAPPDQQVDAIRPNERLVLENLLRDHPRLVTSLAPITPRVRIERTEGAAQELEMRCDTLAVDTDRGTCTLTWRRQVLLDQEAVKQVVVAASQGPAAAAAADAPGRRRVTWALDADPPPAEPRFARPSQAPPAGDGTETVIPSLVPGPELPFVKGSQPPQAIVPSPRRKDFSRTRPSGEPMKPALPFRTAPVAAPPVEAEPPVVLPTPPPAAMPGLVWSEDNERTQPVNASALRGAPATPWSEGAARSPTVHPPDPGAEPRAEGTSPPGAPDALDTLDIPATDPLRALLAPMFEPAPPEPVRVPLVPVYEPAPPEPARVAPLLAYEPAPTFELRAEPPPAPAPAPAEPPAPAPDEPGEDDTVSIAGAPARPPGPPPLPIEAYPLERCAAIAASIARAAPDKGRILRDQDLRGDVWTALDRHYNDEVRAQAGRGRTAPLRAYDTAYVAQLEKERGPLRVEEIARLVVAEERGAVDEELDALRLPRGTLLRIRRVWLAREASDPELGRSVRAAVEAAREDD